MVHRLRKGLGAGGSAGGVVIIIDDAICGIFV
jgi:hypothetical protein